MIVGLTGGIATGKSTVAKFLRALEAVVVDADQVSRDVVRPGTPGLAAIIARFGPSVLAKDATLDRTKLRAIVMSDTALRRQLEAITHPLIRAEITTRVQTAITSGAPSVFVEAALLVETGSASLYPHLWVVTCTAATQRARLMAREGCDEQTARRWIETQMPLSEKVKHATQVITNDGDTSALRLQVETAYSNLMAQRPDRD